MRDMRFNVTPDGGGRREGGRKRAVGRKRRRGKGRRVPGQGMIANVLTWPTKRNAILTDVAENYTSRDCPFHFVDEENRLHSMCQ